jgi:hypothetical protein
VQDASCRDVPKNLNRMKLVGLIIFFSAATLMCCSNRLNQPKKDWAYFEDWDKNHDSSLDRAEFAQGYNEAKFFAKWDSKLKPVSTGDFFRREFASLDQNQDNVLDSTEYKSRRTIWSFPGDLKLASWDSNHDKSLALDEFRQAATQNLEHTFDKTADGQITESEMAQAMFEVCDKNNDDQVRGTEFYLWEVYRK